MASRKAVERGQACTPPSLGEQVPIGTVGDEEEQQFKPLDRRPGKAAEKAEAGGPVGADGPGVDGARYPQGAGARTGETSAASRKVEETAIA